MADFVKIHGLRLAGASWIENLTIEKLAADPDPVEIGRIWYNSTDDVFKAAFDDGAGASIVKAFSTATDLADYVALMASAQGAANVGYDGYSASGGTFSVEGGTVADTIDALIEKVATIEAEGGDGVAVSDEGSAVLSSTKSFNFVGDDVLAVQSGPNETTVYVPTPDFAPAYNSEAAAVPSVSLTNRAIADGGSDFEIGDWTAGTDHPATTASALTYTTGAQASFNDKTTTLTATVYGADGSTIVEQAQIVAVDDTNLVGSTANITITVSEWEADYFRYKANVSVEFRIGDMLPNGGRFQIEIAHDNSILGTFTKTQGPMFLDKNSAAASIASISIAENTPTIKQLSGVAYYTNGSTFDLALSDIDNINDSTWPANDNVVYVQSNTEYGIPNRYLTGSGDITGWTSAWNAADLAASFVGTLARASFRYIGTAANVSCYPIDWTNGSTVNSANASILIDTYGVTSDALEEEFDDEAQRLQSDLSTAWDSTALLETTDLMVQGGVLKRQEGDWTGYTPANTADYSAANSETQVYYREFVDAGTAHSNGLLYIGGVTESNISNNDVLISISTNGTDWYSCNSDYTSGALSDGSGCRINSVSQQMPYLEFTLGTGGSTDAGSGSAGYGLFVKVEMPSGSSVEMSALRITNW